MKEAIENVGQTISTSLQNCFSLPDTEEIIETMLVSHDSVDTYLNSIKDFKEVLTDPNLGLSAADLRLGKAKPVKVWNFLKKKTKSRFSIARCSLKKNGSMKKFY